MGELLYSAPPDTSRASSGEQNRTLRHLTFTLGKRKNLTALNPGNQADGEAVELTVLAGNPEFEPRCEHWRCAAARVLSYPSLEASYSNFQ